MRVPVSWLEEHCDPGLDPEALADRLSMTGTEVERVGRAGAPSPDGFVVGRVVSVERHPNADRLTVCAVDTGEATRTIVCGAPNVAEGQAVAVALPGAVLPDGRELGRATLRGVVSDGMILSETELRIGDDAEGILVLADDRAAPGTPLSTLLPISEPVLDLEVTPNRVDCLGVYGVAREVHAVTGAPLAPPPWDDDAPVEGAGAVEDYASVTVEAPELCPRFTARVFTDVAIGPSPPWLQGRLMAAGQRPISNVVDISNYVMLLTAQPLHAFDLDRVPDGALIVRRAADGERMTTLDGIERVFDRDSVLVCDRTGPSGIAGIMGGQVSEVSEATTRVLLEVATWNGVNILRTSAMLGLRSEASTRFEKQLHPELTIRAQRVASRLLVELCGAKLVPGTLDAIAEIPAPHVISLHGARVERLLGMPIERGRGAGYLKRLGFGVELEGEEDLRVSVPPDRHYDVTREVDLVEEVARVHGLDEHLPSTLPAHGELTGRLERDQVLRRRVDDVMRDLGFDEVVSWSFVDAELVDRLRLGADDPRRDGIAIHNPISQEGSVMRTTLLGGLLDAVRHNLAHHAERVVVFESGRVYLRRAQPGGGGVVAGEFVGDRPAPIAEPHRLGCLVVGPLKPPSWRGSGAPAGFYEVKGALGVLCGHLDAEPRFGPALEPFLRPGRAATIELAGRAAGWLGELHPEVAAEWDLPHGAGFEVDLAPLLEAAAAGREQYEDVTTYPSSYQDIAVVVASEVPAERVRDAVLAAAGDLLRSATIFDLYSGEQVGEGRKSLALRLEFRAPDRTLTDEEVGKRREAIKRALEKIGGSLRE
ncbi:MAG TPA: phenylalanine--tRNA ligase subunit beta [Solirubrobacterales bacterium]|nr:phenylalanine--tRNA ligase subunit beta [Solirubrobacterales bacterium]